MAQVDGSNGNGERRAESRREDDRWLRDMIRALIGAHNRRLRKVLISVATGYLILVLGISTALFMLERRDTNRIHAAQDRARTAALAECARVNLLRRQENRTSEIVFATLFSSSIRERSLAHGSAGHTHAASARALDFLARRALHTHLTSCRVAVDDAAHYRAPKPRPFNPRTDPLTLELVRHAGIGQ